MPDFSSFERRQVSRSVKTGFGGPGLPLHMDPSPPLTRHLVPRSPRSWTMDSVRHSPVLCWLLSWFFPCLASHYKCECDRWTFGFLFPAGLWNEGLPGQGFCVVGSTLDVSWCNFCEPSFSICDHRDAEDFRLLPEEYTGPRVNLGTNSQISRMTQENKNLQCGCYELFPDGRSGYLGANRFFASIRIFPHPNFYRHRSASRSPPAV